MEALIQYGFQVSIAITMFYGLYLLILRNETFYKANRYYLIFGMLLAVILPLFPISYKTPISLGNNADFFSLTDKYASDHTLAIQEGATQKTWTYIDFLIAFYALGFIIFLARLIWQSLSVSQKIKNSNYTIIDGIKVVDQPGVMPYSFFNVVFIDIQKYSERELSNIIAHEKVHIQERHWIDLLIIELLAVLFWINPVVWLYEKSIKQNHEYLADQGVLLAGYSPGQYQALLINQLMGVKVLGFAHNLNFSLNKKRMEMMKKEKSPGASKMKLLLALPIIALLVFAFARREYILVGNKADPLLNQEIIGQDKVLNSPLQIWGKVLTTDKNPIEHATFICQGKTLDFNSNSRGEFMIEFPAEYKYTESIIDVGSNKKLAGLKIMVNREGFESASMLIDPKIPFNSREVLLRKEATVKGQIFENNGEIIADARIVLEGSNIETTSDLEGKFEIEAAEGRILMLSHPKYKTIHLALVGENFENPTIIMKKGKDTLIKVRGKVVDDKGNPMTGANVVVKRTNNGTVVDRQGEFQLETPEEFSLVVSYVGYKTFYKDYFTKNSSEVNVKITLDKGIYDIELPKVEDGERLVNGEIIEVPPPPPPPKENKKGEIFTIVEDMPSYKNGGMYKLALDLKEQTARVLQKTKDRGETIVGFTVTPEGKVTNTHIVQSANSKMLDASAMKIIAKLDNWSPGIQRGKKVPVDLTIPVNFN